MPSVGWADRVAVAIVTGIAAAAALHTIPRPAAIDARHSWLDALSSAGALAGLVAVALGRPGAVPGVVHAHARACWTGRTLRVEVEGWVDRT